MTARMPDDANALDAAQALVLTPLERAAGLVAGPYVNADPLPPAPDTRSPRQVLEDVIVANLARTPCVVSFSGGRDSSSVLATAVAVARREGIPLPVPVSLRFPGTPSTDETEWQELVIRHLGVTDWERIVIGAEQWPGCLNPMTECASSSWYLWTTEFKVLPAVWDTTSEGTFEPTNLVVGEPVVTTQ